MAAIGGAPSSATSSAVAENAVATRMAAAFMNPKAANEPAANVSTSLNNLKKVQRGQRLSEHDGEVGRDAQTGEALPLDEVHGGGGGIARLEELRTDHEEPEGAGDREPEVGDACLAGCLPRARHGLASRTTTAVSWGRRAA